MMNDFEKDKDVLVSKKAAVDLLEKWADGYDYIEIPTKDAIKEFMSLPPAQSEIVQCKDCTHFHRDTWGSDIGLERENIMYNFIVGHNTCDRWSEGHNQVTEEGYCFLSERRADG